MAYSVNVKDPARRHFRAALVLHEQNGAGDQPGCRAVAGYLFGIAGELAVKEIMRDSGIRPLSDGQRHDDPFYAHFPALKRQLATAQGRRSGELRKISENQQLFQQWDTSMRYAPTSEIGSTWVSNWKDSAEKLMTQMEAV